MVASEVDVPVPLDGPHAAARHHDFFRLRRNQVKLFRIFAMIFSAKPLKPLLMKTIKKALRNYLHNTLKR